MKFKKISAILGAAFVGVSTLGFAAAANFPAPFVDNGVADVAVVYGSGAASSDSVAANNIQSTLADEMPSTGSEVTIDGDSYLLKATGNDLTLGEDISTVVSDLDDTDLDLLERGTLVDDDVEYDEDEEVDYSQEINLPSNSVTFGDLDEDDYVVNTDLASDELPVLYIDQLTEAYTLEVDFATAINATAYDGSESIDIFGKTLTFDPNMEAGDDELVFFESTETVVIDYGESETINGDTVEVTGGTENTANIVINGKSYSVSEGDTKEGYYFNKVISSTIGDGSVSVEIFVGANEWTLEDTYEVEVDDEDVDGVTVDFDGTLEALEGLTFTVNPSNMDEDESQYLEIGETFVDPLFGSFALVFDSVEPELKADSKGIIELASDETVDLEFVSRNGNEYSISPFEISSDNENVTAGEDWYVDGSELTDLEKDHIFIAYEGTADSSSEETLVLKIKSIDDSDESGSVTFEDLSDGSTFKVYENKEIKDTGLWLPSTVPDGTDSVTLYDQADQSGTSNVASMYNVLVTEDNMKMTLANEVVIDASTSAEGDSITINGVTYTHTNGTSDDSDDTNDEFVDTATLLAELENDDYSATETGDVITIANFEVDTYSSSGIAVSNTATIKLEEDPEDVFNSDVTTGDITFEVGVDTDDDYLTLKEDSSNEFEILQNSETDMEYGLSELGTYYEADDEDYQYVNLWVPSDGEAIYNVYVAEADSVTTSGGASSLGDIVVLDSEVDEVEDKNLIIVGGSCINTAAASVLGVSEGTCGEAFTDATDVGAGNFLIQSVGDAYTDGKIALVVAGYEADDTTTAATYLRTEDVDTSAGQKKIYSTVTSTEVQ